MTTNTPSEQPAIPAGMVAWHGGDSAPDDWDGGPVIGDDGDWYECDEDGGLDWSHGLSARDIGADIIAYTPAIPASADGAGATELLGEALFALSAHLKELGFLDRAPHHLAYERVVAAFNALPVDQPAQASEVEREFAARMTVACDRTRAVRGRNEVAVQTSDWHALMSLASAIQKRAALAPQSERAEAGDE